MLNRIDQMKKSAVLLLFLALLMLIQIPAASAQKSYWNPNQISTAENEWTGIAPYPEAQQCWYHNVNEWHGLWNPEAGCYYDHEHKDNPGIIYNGMSVAERAKAEKLNEIFGKPGAWFGGTSISYPWQTFMGAGDSYDQPMPGAHFENTHKHEGYGWISRVDLPPNGQHWIKDFRVQYHAIFATVGAKTRFHSFSMEANICKRQGECQIIRTGGHMDFGHLKVFGGIVPIAGQEGDGSRQRLHRTYRYPEFALDPSFKTSAVWYGSFTRHDHAQKSWLIDPATRPFRQLTLVLESQDIWSNTDQRDLTSTAFFCPEFDCDKNNSTLKLHRMQINLVSEEPFSGYTDRYGLASDQCYAPGLDCIPTVIELGGRVNTIVSERQMYEFDVSPAGTYWIKYPN